MKQFSVILAALISTGAAMAATSGPSMQFLAAPARQEQGALTPTRAQSRVGDRMVVVVKEPAACGQRLTDPHYVLNDGVLHLGFQVPAADAQAQTCIATAIFTLKGLPPEPVLVQTEAGAAMTAWAQTDTASPLPVKFLAGAARPVNGIAQAEVRQVRTATQLIAVVTQPAACGTRLSDPSVTLDESKLSLRYRVTEAASQAKSCAATAVFSVKGLPQRELTTVAEATLRRGSAGPAMATQAAAAPGPKMSFVGVPAISQSTPVPQRDVVQARNGDAMNVIVHEPAACGERLQRASFSLEGRQLFVHYQVPVDQASTSGCVATAMILFRGLPSDDIQVVAVSDPAPVANLALVRPQAKMD